MKIIKLLISLPLWVAPFVCFGQADTTSLEGLTLKDLLNVKIVTASRSFQNSESAPATIHVISQKEIRMRGYQSLLDLIADLPDIKVDDKIYPDRRNSITVRGTQGQQNFLILLNGLKISSPTNEAMPIMENYPVNLAEQVEVMYGPGSALYGADAVSGVINIITIKIPDDKDVIADANAVMGSYGYINSTFFVAKKIAKESSFTISGQYNFDKQPDYTKIYPDEPQLSGEPYQTGTFKTIFGIIKPSTPLTSYEAPTSAYNIYAALSIKNFDFAVFTNYAKIPSAYSNNTNNAIYNKNVFTGQRITTASASYREQFNKLVSTTTLSASGYTLDPETNYRNMYTSLEPAYKYSTSTNIKAEQQLDYNANDKFNITVGGIYETLNSIPQSADLAEPANPKNGLSGRIAGSSSFYSPEGLPAHFYNIKYENAGAYFQGQYSPNSVFGFTLGARYDHNSRYGNTFNPRMGIVITPNSRLNIKALYGSAYLAPAPSSAYVQYGSFTTADSGRTYHSSFLHLPNPGLKPIRSENFELNIRQYITNSFTVTADGYYSVLNGLYIFADDNTSTRLYNNNYNGILVDYIEVFVNQGRQINYGGSLQLNLKHTLGNAFLNSWASISYVNGLIFDPKTGGKAGHFHSELPFISPFTLRVGTDIQTKKFTFSPRLLILSRQNLPGVRDTIGENVQLQTIAGYALLNLSTRYQLTNRFSIFMNVKNALDRRYRSVSYLMDLNKKDTELFHGQPEDPIRIMGGINFRIN